MLVTSMKQFEAASYSKMTAEVYDAIYSWKDYQAEAKQLKKVIERAKQSSGNDLLDVACGTGSHITYLKADFKVTGLDLSAEQIAWASNRFPEIDFHQADMTNFQLDQSFDVVTCLFRSIGYAHQLSQMRQAVTTMAKHLKPGGLLVVDPWLMEHEFDSQDKVWATFVDEPELKISRFHSTPKLKAGVSTLELHNLVGRPSGIDYFVESHRMGVYSKEQYLQAITAATLEASFEPADKEQAKPLRLFIGIKPQS